MNGNSFSPFFNDSFRLKNIFATRYIPNIKKKRYKNGVNNMERKRLPMRDITKTNGTRCLKLNGNLANFRL